LQLAEEEREGVSTKCIPRKPKTLPAKKEGNNDGSCMAGGSSQRGSKRLDV
jgi:hypothetical protein